MLILALLSASLAFQLVKCRPPLITSRAALSPTPAYLPQFRSMRSLYRTSLLAAPAAPDSSFDELDDLKKKIAAIEYCLKKLSGFKQKAPPDLKDYIAIYSSHTADKLVDLLSDLQKEKVLLISQRSVAPIIPAGE